MLYVTTCINCGGLLYTKKKTQMFCTPCSDKYRALMVGDMWKGSPTFNYLADKPEEDDKNGKV